MELLPLVHLPSFHISPVNAFSQSNGLSLSVSRSSSLQALLKGLNLGAHRFEFSSMALALSLEGKASHRELTSRLLSDLSGKLMSQVDMVRAFDKLLKDLPELILDTPDAPKVGRAEPRRRRRDILTGRKLHPLW